MSSDDNSEAAVADIFICCASCGIAEEVDVDDVKLKECDGCDLVKYCSDSCQRYHRPDHEAACKERAAELRDEILFKQPERSCYGDCPLCFLPFPAQSDKRTMSSCCSKIFCKGCAYVYDTLHLQENKYELCPFCRHPVPETDEETMMNDMRRASANDPVALNQLGFKHQRNGDYDDAIKYWTRGTELGDVEAHYNLSLMYEKGEGVEKDEKKRVYHLEEAAIGGHPDARFIFALYEESKGEIERAVKHFIIAANLGDDESIQKLKQYYKNGNVSKEDFAAALRTHYAAVNETKSPQREAATKFFASN